MRMCIIVISLMVTFTNHDTTHCTTDTVTYGYTFTFITVQQKVEKRPAVANILNCELKSLH